MRWLWNNLERGGKTKVIIWDDVGRVLGYPDGELPLYYNPDGGNSYHSKETCYSTKDDLVLTAFPYGDLENEPYASLKRCTYCAPLLREAEIAEINAAYAPGLDHDPIMTEARIKQLEKESKNKK